MNPTKAIRIAQARVHVVEQGNSFVLHTYDPKVSATRISHSTDRDGARGMAWERKVAIALELLGIPELEAEEIANDEAGHNSEGFTDDWRQVVRAHAKKIAAR